MLSAILLQHCCTAFALSLTLAIDCRNGEPLPEKRRSESCLQHIVMHLMRCIS